MKIRISKSHHLNALSICRHTGSQTRNADKFAQAVQNWLLLRFPQCSGARRITEKRRRRRLSYWRNQIEKWERKVYGR